MNGTIDTGAYPVRVRRLPERDGGGWLAEVPDLPGCTSDGETPAEAVENVQGAILSWIEAAEDLGRPVPPPMPTMEGVYSGKWQIRMARSLHQRLAERARQEGVSLNAFATGVLAEALGRCEAGDRPARAAGRRPGEGPPAERATGARRLTESS